MLIRKLRVSYYINYLKLCTDNRGIGQDYNRIILYLYKMVKTVNEDILKDRRQL